ncbi:hypothetical protein [Azospirillum doebereinerae]
MATPAGSALGERTIYLNRNQFWTNHLFDPFLAWVDTELFQATAIRFWGDIESGTWAKLLTKEQADAVRPGMALPLWKG